MNATVTLPISELDNLRDTIKDLTSKCADYEKTSKQVKLTLIDKYYSVEPNDMGWSRIQYVNKQKTVETHQYINLEDIIDVLKYEQEQKVIDKLSKLEYEIKSLNEKNSKQYNEFVDKVNTLRKEHEEEVKKKENEIKVLKGELVDLNKDQEIEKLNNQLNNQTKKINDLQSKVIDFNEVSFFQKLKFLFK